jgi:hypothetical protein
MSFKIINKSLFDIPADAFVNTINCVGAMGSGVALEFKNRYPDMFIDYKEKCNQRKIKPGDCYVYFDEETEIYLLGLAVKNDWRYWSTFEWMEGSLKSLKLTMLENDIKSVNMPLIGGKNGRRGPYGKVPNMTEPPPPEEIKKWLISELSPFSSKFNIDINLCIPEEKVVKPEIDLTEFFGYKK